MGFDNLPTPPASTGVKDPFANLPHFGTGPGAGTIQPVFTELHPTTQDSPSGAPALSNDVIPNSTHTEKPERPR